MGPDCSKSLGWPLKGLRRLGGMLGSGNEGDTSIGYSATLTAATRRKAGKI